MSYKVLARKYRPSDFTELRGQDALVKTLTNAIIMNRVHHAYILTGIRGIGKTTTARISAKSLNCTASLEERESSLPGKLCDNCKMISAGSHPDIIEFDAASNTGIEDVKIVIDACKYEAIKGKYKIFIIDEVHMLSVKAFNSLLKTLEEPPKNVLFIFATTDLRKVPITLLSRCQKFYLRALNNEEIANYLLEIADKENVILDRKIAQMIALKSEGSVRDSLSIMDQAIANSILKNQDTSDNINTIESNNSENLRKITILPDVVTEMLSISNKDAIVEMLSNLFSGKFNESLECMHKLLDYGTDERTILTDLMYFVNYVMKIKINFKENIVSEVLMEQNLLNQLKELSSRTSMSFIVRFWQILSKGNEEMFYIPDKRLALEMILLKASYASNLPSSTEIIERLKNQDLNDIINAFEDSKMLS